MTFIVLDNKWPPIFLYFISRSKVSANKVGVSIGKFLLYDPALGHLRMDRGHVLDDAGTGAYSQGLRVWWAATSARDGLAATLIYAYAAEYTILADVRDDVRGAAAALRVRPILTMRSLLRMVDAVLSSREVIAPL